MTITELTRRAIVDALALKGDISGRLNWVAFLERIWPLSTMPSRDPRFEDAAGDAWQHLINNDDWDESYLFYDYLDILSAPDALFLKFVEQVVHPMVRIDRDQAETLSLINQYLQRDGCKLAQVDALSGHPIYQARSQVGGRHPTPKNLIFAADGAKPEIVLADAINNDIRITRNADKCLVYPRLISPSGLSWGEMVAWWADERGVAADDPRTARSLYRRLFSSLGSPPEELLFDTYYRALLPRVGLTLPALIPQVYLHYDPYTQKARGGTGPLARQRMDFLLLLPQSRRVVVEVDGKQHYARGEIAAPKLYAAMVAEDRELKLAGYEVYRFGGSELRGASGKQVVEDFFTRLLSSRDVRMEPPK